MGVLRKVNEFMYDPRFSMFDLIWITVIGTLAADYSYWWFLLLLPVTIFSVIMERHLKKD